jgi:hypothetical protein
MVIKKCGVGIEKGVDKWNGNESLEINPHICSELNFLQGLQDNLIGNNGLFHA